MTAPAPAPVDDEAGTEGTTPGANGPENEGAADGPLLKADGTPYTQADVDALQTALRKARKDARDAARGRGTAAPAESGPGASGALGAPTDGAGAGVDVDKVRADTEADAAARWKPLLVKTAARTAFVEAGLALPQDGADAAMARVIRLLDLDDLDVTDDGQVDGLREQVEDIRRDFPELFAATRKAGAVPPPRVDAAGKSAPGSAPKTAAERLVAQLTGR